MKVILTGGGTGGSITPLLAIKDTLSQQENCQFLFIGTSHGPAKNFAEENYLPYREIMSGKVRRYWHWQNLIDPLRIIIGFFQSLRIIREFQPQVIITAGSFVAVPVVWAGWIHHLPCLIHQQDLQKGLANRLMSPFAKKITVTFPASLHHFPKEKTVLTGNPVRQSIKQGNHEEAIKIFNLKKNLLTVLIIGGGTGALAINKFVSRSLALLRFCQIIHVAGKGKNIFQDKLLSDLHRPTSIAEVISEHELGQKKSLLSRYHVYEFLSEELPHAYAVADVVITRAGMSCLTELACLKKPIIIIPLPASHQEENARYFEQNDAAHILNQKNLTSEILTNTVKQLLHNHKRRIQLGENAHQLFPDNASQTIVREIMKIRKND